MMNSDGLYSASNLEDLSSFDDMVVRFESRSS